MTPEITNLTLWAYKYLALIHIQGLPGLLTDQEPFGNPSNEQ
jgi:hypothetical protein